MTKKIDDIEEVVRGMSSESSTEQVEQVFSDKIDDPSEIKRLIEATKVKMLAAAEAHEFEDAARLRDEMKALKNAPRGGVKVDYDKRAIERFPRSPGVYIMKGSSDEVIYVGKASNLRARSFSIL